jgi:hypothetical protein
MVSLLRYRVDMKHTQLAVLALVALSVNPVCAESTASLQVSVHVIARAVVSVERDLGGVLVTPADLERGFVDLPAPVELRVRTNSRRGYVLQFNNMSNAFTAIELRGNGVTIHVAEESFLQRTAVAGGDRLVLSARVWLRPGSTPGRYDVPIMVQANPL